MSSVFHKEEPINADDLCSIVPYILVKAKFTRLMSLYNYIKTFHFSNNDSDETAVFLVNLDIAM